MARLAQFALLFCLLVAPAQGQDAVRETPPELRDFRIDPERAQPQPTSGPEIRPSPTPPVTEPVVPERTPDTSSGTPIPTPNATSPRRVPEVTQPADPAPSTTTPAPISTQPVDNTAEATPQAAPTPAITAPQSSPEARTDSPLPVDSNWLAAAVALLVLLGVLLAGWFMWRRKQDGFAQMAESPPTAHNPLIEDTSAPNVAATPMPQTAEIRPQITLEFKPERATLSFTALTVKGTLFIENRGQDTATDMHMRATMISANQEQATTIAAFFNQSIPVEDNILGDAKAGEKIALELEISIPSQELQSYSVAERRIVVPVIIADLSYRWSGGQDSSRLACLVGREAQSPHGKMGPLRLDLGPRSFTPLGQRPLYA
jgi:hypothetical protein